MNVTMTATITAEDRFRTRIGADIATIRGEIQRNPHRDALSVRIQEWHHRFTESYRAGGGREQEILNASLISLHAILHSPTGNTPLDPSNILSNVPLDAESYMEEPNGHTYPGKALLIYLHSIPRRDRIKLPFDPTSEAAFTVVPHTLARFMVAWLERYQSRERNAEQERRYEELRERNELPELPNRTFVRRIRFEQRREEAEERELRPFREQVQRTMGEARANVQEQMGAVRLTIEANEVQRIAQVQALREQQASADNQQRREIQALEGRIQVVEEGTENLQNSLDTAAQKMEELKKSQADLKKSIDEVKKPPKKKKKWKKIAKTIGIAAAVVVATVATQGTVTFSASSGGKIMAHIGAAI